jgi:hypothetical protein
LYACYIYFPIFVSNHYFLLLPLFPLVAFPPLLLAVGKATTKVVSRFLFHASFLRNRAGGKASPCFATFLWPLAFGLWPLAFGLWPLEGGFSTGRKNFPFKLRRSSFEKKRKEKKRKEKKHLHTDKIAKVY